MINEWSRALPSICNHRPQADLTRPHIFLSNYVTDLDLKGCTEELLGTINKPTALESSLASSSTGQKLALCTTDRQMITVWMVA